MYTDSRAARGTGLPERDSFSDEEDQKEYDYVHNRVLKLTGHPPADIPYVGACLNSPPFAASLWRFSGRMLAAFSLNEHTSHRDRDYINVVLGFDLECYTNEMAQGHLRHAVESLGLRPEMVRAVWYGRDDELTSDERQLVDYIRAYVNGTVTDEMWAGIVERFGSVRSAVEYSLSIGYNLLCARSMQAFGIPQFSREEMEQFVDNLRAGDEENRDSTAGLERSFNDPAFLAEMSGG